MDYSRPVQVFTDIKSRPKPAKEFVVSSENMNNAKSIKEAVTLSMLDRQITVTGMGELEFKPDRFCVTFRSKASKENIQDAKNSVIRRLDYIIQTLRNHYLKEQDYSVYQHVNYQNSMAVYECEIEAHFLDIGKCLTVSNFLVEKLGPGITATFPVCYHTSESLDKLRKQAGMLAIHNARQKAMEMAKVIHMSVGAPLQVEEQGCSEYQGTASSDSEELDLTPGIRQSIAEKTVKISSKVSVSFQLRPSRKKVLA